jgi:hypothetical protein
MTTTELLIQPKAFVAINHSNISGQTSQPLMYTSSLIVSNTSAASAKQYCEFNLNNLLSEAIKNFKCKKAYTQN